jgi:hypothetical protein
MYAQQIYKEARENTAPIWQHGLCKTIRKNREKHLTRFTKVTQDLAFTNDWLLIHYQILILAP